MSFDCEKPAGALRHPSPRRWAARRLGSVVGVSGCPLMSEDPSESVEFGPQLDIRPHQGTVFRYAIFSQQRSGSGWLTTRLINLGAFGVPAEYLNPLVIPKFAERLHYPIHVSNNVARLNLKKYFEAVESVRTSSSGRFGVKIQPNQLFPLFNGDLAAATTFLRRYDALIVLTCRDKLRQAVSGTIAAVTGRWRPDEEPDLSGVNMEELVSKTAATLARYIDEDRIMSTISRSTQRPMLCLTYEQMVADPDGTLEEILRFLGHKEGLSHLPKINALKVSDRRPGRVNAEVRQRFLDYIEGRISN